MGGGWVEADLRCNLSDDILMESDPLRLVLYSSSSLVPINKHLSQGDSVGFPGVIFGCDFQV